MHALHILSLWSPSYLPAAAALVRLLARVNPAMVVQVPGGSEPFGAVRTGKRQLPAVFPHVDLKYLFYSLNDLQPT